MTPKEAKFPYRRRLNQERAGLERFIDKWKHHPAGRIKERVENARRKLEKVEVAISLARELKLDVHSLRKHSGKSLNDKKREVFTKHRSFIGLLGAIFYGGRAA